jgi:hypothetical protein
LISWTQPAPDGGVDARIGCAGIMNPAGRRLFLMTETLPRKPEGKEALVRRINERHQRRLGAIQSRFRTAAKSQPP